MNDKVFFGGPYYCLLICSRGGASLPRCHGCHVPWLQYTVTSHTRGTYIQLELFFSIKNIKITINLPVNNFTHECLNFNPDQ